MNNFIQNGDQLTVLAPADVTSGLGVLVGAIFGMAQAKVAQGGRVVLVRKGVFSHAKIEAQAWALGAKVYWDDTAKKFTTTATGNKLVGAAVEAAADPSSTGVVLLDGVVR